MGMLLAWLASMLCKGKWRLYLLPLAAGIMVACIDETIQLFVPGRAGLITDVGIDALGCALGIVLINVSKQLKINFLEETK